MKSMHVTQVMQAPTSKRSDGRQPGLSSRSTTWRNPDLLKIKHSDCDVGLRPGVQSWSLVPNGKAASMSLEGESAGGTAPKGVASSFPNLGSRHPFERATADRGQQPHLHLKNSSLDLGALKDDAEKAGGVGTVKKRRFWHFNDVDGNKIEGQSPVKNDTSPSQITGTVPGSRPKGKGHKGLTWTLGLALPLPDAASGSAARSGSGFTDGGVNRALNGPRREPEAIQAAIAASNTQEAQAHCRQPVPVIVHHSASVQPGLNSVEAETMSKQYLGKSTCVETVPIQIANHPLNTVQRSRGKQRAVTRGNVWSRPPDSIRGCEPLPAQGVPRSLRGGKVWVRPGSHPQGHHTAGGSINSLCISPLDIAAGFLSPRPLAAAVAARALSMARRRGAPGALTGVSSDRSPRAGVGLFTRGKGRTLVRTQGGVGEIRIAGGVRTNGRITGSARGASSVGRGRGRGRGRVAGGSAFVPMGSGQGRHPPAKEGKGIAAARKRLVRLSDGQLHHVVVLGAPGAARKLQTVSLPPPAVAAAPGQAVTRGRRGGRVVPRAGGRRYVVVGLKTRRTAVGSPYNGTPLTPKTWPRTPSLRLPLMIWRRPGSSLLSPTGGLSAAAMSPSASAAASVRARALLAARGTPRGGKGRVSRMATTWSLNGPASSKPSIKRSSTTGSSSFRPGDIKGGTTRGSSALGIGLRTFCPRYCLTGVCEEASAFMGRTRCPFQHDPKKVFGSRGASSQG